MNVDIIEIQTTTLLDRKCVNHNENGTPIQYTPVLDDGDITTEHTNLKFLDPSLECLATEGRHVITSTIVKNHNRIMSTPGTDKP